MKSLVAPSLVLALAVMSGCGDGESSPDAPLSPDAPPDTMPEGNPLVQTGLCTDDPCMQIAPGVRPYAPQFSLWDDQATKRRWIYLPPGSKIDTTDMDHWVFPVGTKLWKEFSRDGIRVETRMIEKKMQDDEAIGAWSYATYEWNAEQNRATPIIEGHENANGTQHDIPTRSDCRACHDRMRPSRVLGFSAIQLDLDAPAGDVDLDALIAEGALTTAVPGAATPHFPLPGTAVDREALGYLHANCGHCHNPTSDVHDLSPMHLRLRVGMLGSLAGTPAYATTVGVAAKIPFTEAGTTYTTLIVPGDPETSSLFARMNSTQAVRFMPNLAVEDIDPAGHDALRAWIQSL